MWKVTALLLSSLLFLEHFEMVKWIFFWISLWINVFLWWLTYLLDTTTIGLDCLFQRFCLFFSIFFQFHRTEKLWTKCVDSSCPHSSCVTGLYFFKWRGKWFLKKCLYSGVMFNDLNITHGVFSFCHYRKNQRSAMVVSLCRCKCMQIHPCFV